MEITRITARPAVAQGRTAPPAAERQTARGEKTADRVDISREALEKLKEEQAARKAELEQFRRDAEAAKEAGEATAEGFKVMMRCLKIAGRIMDGDKVPPEDQNYLLEHDPKMYQLAMAARRPKEDPEEWDSVLEDEEEEPSGGGEPAPLEEGTPVEAEMPPVEEAVLE